MTLRDEALARLYEFVPRAGREYAARRNFDLGPLDRSNVSMLAPYLRARVISEDEVIRAVLARHSPSAAYKFIAEVFWRTYWKGWLQAHPSVWTDYLREVDDAYEALQDDPPAAARYADAVAGRTGNDAFDTWARELVEHGYLHNHARMWFASIWVFTFGLPWQLGADFFMQHLRCGDPAANTLSWRWVVGLHTRGRTYLATRENIRRYTDGRLEPGSDLARKAVAIEGPAYPVQPVDYSPTPVPEEAAVFLIHDDDASAGDIAEEFGARLDVRATIAIENVAGRTPRGVAVGVQTFARAALMQRVATTGLQAAPLTCDTPGAIATASDTIAAVARENGATCIVTPVAPIGPTATALDSLSSALDHRGLKLHQIRRVYDTVSWPYARSGYFALGKRVPHILTLLNL